MSIDWQSRIKNPTWWVQVVVAIVMPLIIGVGYQWSDMTSWGKFFDTLFVAVQNPVVVVAMLTSLWTAITNPMTPGTFDNNAGKNTEE